MPSNIEPVKQGRGQEDRGNSQIICVRIPSGLLDKVERLADQNSVTRSSVIIHALRTITE